MLHPLSHPGTPKAILKLISSFLPLISGLLARNSMDVGGQPLGKPKEQCFSQLLLLLWYCFFSQALSDTSGHIPDSSIHPSITST